MIINAEEPLGCPGPSGDANISASQDLELNPSTALSTRRYRTKVNYQWAIGGMRVGDLNPPQPCGQHVQNRGFLGDRTAENFNLLKILAVYRNSAVHCA